MMKTTLITLLSIGTVFMSGSMAVKAADQTVATAAKAKVTNQTVCPVSGKKIDKKLSVTVKGKRIYVCCPKCAAKVKANPEKYSKKTTEKPTQTAKLKAQAYCPVMQNNKINKNLYVDFKGKRIYVCCKGCLPMVKRHPEKYRKMLKDKGVKVADTPKQ